MARIRIRRMTRLLIALFMLSAPAVMASDPTTITVTKEQSGREVALKVGEILKIELPGRGGTGYSWSAEASGAPFLKLVDQATRQVKEGRPGGPVIQVWRFRAEKPGATEIKMAYFRPWEGVGQAKDRFLVKIRVE
ncbi:MAG: protease inhibitor I42 family protein [Desulfobaccales bacterium]